MRPHRWQPTRLPRPWDSPGKNTGVGCHFFLQCMKVKRETEVAQSCPTPSDPMDCSLPGSSIHGIFQARVLEWWPNLSLLHWKLRVLTTEPLRKSIFFGKFLAFLSIKMLHVLTFNNYFSLIILLKKFYWSVVLQCCVNFCSTAILFLNNLNNSIKNSQF